MTVGGFFGGITFHHSLNSAGLDGAEVLLDLRWSEQCVVSNELRFVSSSSISIQRVSCPVVSWLSDLLFFNCRRSRDLKMDRCNGSSVDATPPLLPLRKKDEHRRDPKPSGGGGSRKRGAQFQSSTDGQVLENPQIKRMTLSRIPMKWRMIVPDVDRYYFEDGCGGGSRVPRSWRMSTTRPPVVYHSASCCCW